MPRKAKLDAPMQMCLKLPTSVRTKLDLHLYSELEQRVPMGAYQEFFIERIRDFFDSRRLDLTPFGLQGFYVFGPKAMIEALEKKLKEVL